MKWKIENLQSNSPVITSPITWGARMNGNLLGRIRTLARHIPIKGFIIKAGEEFGELCSAYNIEYGTKKGELKETLFEEAVDLAIVALGLASLEMTPQQILDRIELKIDKWQKNGPTCSMS